MTTDLEGVDSPCPHCPDGHADPTTRPWAVYVGPERDGDGQPLNLHVGPTNCAHVSESDAAWLRPFLDARDAALAHVPRIGPGVITGWPRTEDDADGEFELTAADLRATLAALGNARGRVAELTVESDRLFILYSTEKTRREQFSDAFDEVRADRDRLAKERAGWRSIAGADEVEADRDAAVARAVRLAARVDQLETLLGQILARFDTKGHPGYAAIRTAWIRAELVAMWRKVAKGRDAGENGDEADSLGRCRDCYGRGDDFEGGTCPACGGTGTEASKPTPACGPTPNALVCACGGPINHAEARE